MRRNTGSMLLGLRIDANGAWDVKQAIRAIEALAHPDIEYVEQPVRSAGDLATLRRRCEVPIAADELVTGVAAAEELLALDAADILIVKPQMVGGLAAGREIISLAAERGKRAVVTTSIETGVGIAAALHLAATLIDPLACGLATAELLAHDLLVEPLEIEDGMMRLPDAPGLGVTLDEEAVERYRVGEA